MATQNDTGTLYNFIHDYVNTRSLTYSQIAIHASRDALAGKIRMNTQFDREGILKQTFFTHCLSVTKMLIDLKIPLTDEEEDILIASALLHDTIAHGNFKNHGLELLDEYHLPRRVYDIVKMTTKANINSESDLQHFYDKIVLDKLAVLLSMADRGNLVENLYALSFAESMDYIRELRKYALPMCIYALEYYPETQLALGIMLAKIRCLVDVTDIVSRRYEERETALVKESLALMEENSKLRGLIAQMG